MERKLFMEKLLERAAQMGFDAYEIYAASGEEFTVAVNGGKIIEYNVASSQGLSFRALIGGKMGYASTQVYDEDAIALLLEGAQSNAKLIENEDEQFIFAGSEAYPQIDAYHPQLDGLSAAEKIDLVKRLEQATIGLDARVKRVQMAELFSGSAEKRIVNSKGLDLTHRDNMIGMYVAAIAEEDGRVSSGADWVFTRDVKDLDVGTIAANAVRMATDDLSGGPMASGTYPVVFRNDAAASMLDCFDSIFSADMAQKGLSLLKGREGEEIAAPAVTIVDDPLHQTALASAPFDAEGVAKARRAIVDRGRLTTLLHNLKTAKKQGVLTTGNAAKGSYASPVGVAPSNFYIEPSETPLSALLERAGDGLMVVDVAGLHAGANQISGDFSLSAKGYRIEGGKIAGAVNQVTVAGNFFELLKGIELVASDLRFGFPGASCAGSPSILVKSLSVAGK